VLYGRKSLKVRELRTGVVGRQGYSKVDGAYVNRDVDSPDPRKQHPFTMASKPNSPIHVLDTCAWIEIVESPKHDEVFFKLRQLIDLGVLRIALPDTVHFELTNFDPGWLKKRKKDWNSRVGELEQFLHHVARNEDPFDPDGQPTTRMLDALDEIRQTIAAYEGDPHRGILSDLLASRNVVRIPAPKAIYADVIESGLRKKRPFSGKNSVADAVILFATARWAERHANESIVFHTLNTKDFSDPKDSRRPHPDIAHLFEPNTNLKYSSGLGQLSRALAPLDPIDFYPRDPEGCSICEEKVLIESISCMSCGNWPKGAPDDEGYTLKRYRGGYLVDVHDPYDGGSFRLECDACGRKTFEVYLNDLCSYHDHVTSKDRN